MSAVSIKSSADTTRDTLIRGLEGSGDIAALEASVSDRRLRLRVTTRRSLSPRLTYTIRLHPLGGGIERAAPLTIPIRRLRSAEPRFPGHGAGRDLQVSVPLSALGEPAAVMVSADSRLGRVAIDRVCSRLLRLPAVR